MPLNSSDPEKLKAKLERAKHHIHDVQAEWRSFFESGGYSIRFDDNAQRGERTYYLLVAEEIPISMKLVIGDAINNLRSSLDHLAHHLMAVGTGKFGPFLNVYFPISESAAKYKSEGARKIKGLRQDAIDAIDATEPYYGGRGHILWQLHRLTNTDKHRLLLTTYGQLLNHSLTPTQRAQITKTYLGSYPGHTPPDLTRMQIAPKQGIVRINHGDKLLTVPLAEVEEYMRFTVDIAFGESGVCEGGSVIETLNLMAEFVERIFQRFDALGLFY